MREHHLCVLVFKASSTASVLREMALGASSPRPTLCQYYLYALCACSRAHPREALSDICSPSWFDFAHFAQHQSSNAKICDARHSQLGNWQLAPGTVYTIWFSLAFVRRVLISHTRRLGELIYRRCCCCWRNLRADDINICGVVFPFAER